MDMLDPVIDFVKAIAPVDHALQEAIRERMELLEVSKKDLLLREGQRCDYIYVVLKGLMHMYYIKDGEEISSRFIQEMEISTSIISFYGRNAGYEYLEALEPSLLARIHYDRLQELYMLFPQFNFIGRGLTERYYVKSEERLYLLRKHSAEERYCYFVDNYPSFYQRVPLKHIASYLGLTLETISRIRKKLSGGKG